MVLGTWNFGSFDGRWWTPLFWLHDEDIRHACNSVVFSWEHSIPTEFSRNVACISLFPLGLLWACSWLGNALRPIPACLTYGMSSCGRDVNLHVCVGVRACVRACMDSGTHAHKHKHADLSAHTYVDKHRNLPAWRCSYQARISDVTNTTSWLCSARVVCRR